MVVRPVPALADSDDPSYSFLSGVQAQLITPGQSPPGANDWSCRPTAEHPNPVVLLHGVSNDTITWQTLAPALSADGYCVFSTTFGTGLLGSTIGAMGPVEDSAGQIGAFIHRVLGATGAERVDLVGHSMGGAVPFYYLEHLGGAPTIDHYLALAAPLHGSTISGLTELLPMVATGPGAAAIGQCGPCQLTPDSPALRQLNPDPAVAPAISFTTIVTRYDEIATPYTTGLLDGPNVHNIVVQDLCPTDATDHNELPADPIVVREIRNTLDPTHAQAPTCTVVLPFLGPP